MIAVILILEPMPELLRPAYAVAYTAVPESYQYYSRHVVSTLYSSCQAECETLRACRAPGLVLRERFGFRGAGSDGTAERRPVLYTIPRCAVGPCGRVGALAALAALAVGSTDPHRHPRARRNVPTRL